MHVQLYVTHFKRKDYGELLEIYEILQSVSKEVLECVGHMKKRSLRVYCHCHVILTSVHVQYLRIHTYIHTYIHTFRHVEGHALM